MDGIEDFDTFFQGALERFATGDEAGAAGSFVDYGRGDGILKVVVAGCAAAIDQARAAHVAVGELIAGEIDRVVGREFGVDTFVELAVA